VGNDKLEVFNNRRRAVQFVLFAGLFDSARWIEEVLHGRAMFKTACWKFLSAKTGLVSDALRELDSPGSAH